MLNVKNKISALLRQWSIVNGPLLIVLLAFASCRDEENVLPAGEERTITLDLGIAMTRATDDKTDAGDNSCPDNLMLWIFDNTNSGTPQRLFYENLTDGLRFSLTDIEGKLVQTIERVINVAGEVTSLCFYIVMNTQGLTTTLDENSTPQAIEAATFSRQDWKGDNKVPIYGSANLDVSRHKSEYSLSIDTERAVGKLELFFTKENKNSYLAINSVSITHEPDKGYLKKPDTYDLTYSENSTIFSTSTSIHAVLTEEEEPTTGNFSKYEDDDTKMQSLFSTYLLENPNGGTWTEVGNNNAYTYPNDPESPSNVTEANTRYKMTVTYQTLKDGAKKMQVIYLPAIERNVWNKVFARVKEDGTLTIQYKVLPWNLVESKKGYMPTPMYTNPFSGSDDKTNQYILLPLEKYSNKHNTTDILFNFLYENPEEGDNEARLCILTRPTYDNANTHNDLKTGSAGARYYFMLTGPEGATWEAHLTNTEDFAFSTSVSHDFDENDDVLGNDSVRMATHGIAREKPYIIQIIANHLYTGYKEGMSGYTSEEGFDSNGYDKITSNWEIYFSDTYLTDWGRAHWEAQEVVDTYFYITVKLKDGQDYVLTINPSYADERYEIKSESKYFPFKEKRRFAGTDTHIWIRQVRARYDWPNLEYLARDLQTDIKDENGNVKDYNRAYWWTVNPYWNPGHDESVWKK